MPRNIWLSRRVRQTQFAYLTRVFYSSTQHRFEYTLNTVLLR